MASDDENEVVNPFNEVIFELFPVFHEGMLNEVDVPVFLEELAKTFRLLNPHSAKLDDFYSLVDGHFVADDSFSGEDGIDIDHEFVQLLTDEKSFLVVVELERGISYSMPEFLASISSTANQFIIFWQFDIDTLELLDTKNTTISPPLNAVSFAFGNIINSNRFVTHLNDLGTTFDPENVALNCSLITNVTVETSETAEKFSVSFKLTYHDPSKSCSDSKMCRFVFDPDSVSEILTTLSNGVEFYFQLDYPPKLYMGSDDDGGVSISAIAASGGEIGVTDDFTRRWNDNRIISRETIGKCNSFMIKFDFNETFDLEPLLSCIYSDFFDKSQPVVITRIKKYCIDYSDALFANNFPYEVRYALECINSVSNAVKDDLYINGTKDAFYNLIQTQLDRGNEHKVVEILYQLYQESVDSDLTNAYNEFSAMFNELGRNGDNSRETRDDMMKKIVLTPMRTIYLPPTPTRTRYMLQNVSSTHTIIVYFRDDDKSHTSCDSLAREIGETDFTQFLIDPEFRNYFLDQVVQRRLFREHGLISAQPLKYLGTSLSQIFSYGILVQANGSH